MSDKPVAVREIRINPVVPSESVLVSTARGMRPRKEETPVPRDTRRQVENCPFCKGNEHMTPPAVAVSPGPESWELRVVENLYPVLGDNSLSPNLVVGLQQAIDGYGRHEVIIDHPQHGITIQEMSEAHLCGLIGMYRERIRSLYQTDERIQYVLVFKNFGPAAGASIAHTHSQVIAMPVVPENVYNEVTHSRRYYQNNRQCIFCSLIDEALTFEATIYDRESGALRRQFNVGQYVVEHGKHFVAIKPFASRYEWEIHILPLRHYSDFVDISDAERRDMARVLKRAMARLDAVIGGAQYNFFLHSIPHNSEFAHCHDSYHWHLEICPRTSIPTGFELGSGLSVSTISPEQAAAQLRAVELD